MDMSNKINFKFYISLIIYIFVISAFIGWSYETIITSIDCGRFVNRGFLNIPICPIYGFGAIILLVTFYKMKNPIYILVASTLFTTLIELIASYAIEYFFHRNLWNYKEWPLNFQGRISLWSSVLFGLFGVLLLKCVYPVTKKIAIHMPKLVRWGFSIFLLVVMLADAYVCLRNI